ncbi:MAG: aminoglycoside phosphotransferase family protein [Pseudomonadota bacterium]
MTRLHADEVVVDAAAVQELLRVQLPELAQLPLLPVAEPGTSNALFRLGDELCLRLPRTPGAAESLERELDCLPRLIRTLPMAVPEPVAVGQASSRYPLPWAVYRWLPGVPCQPGQLAENVAAARQLAQFIEQLQEHDVKGAPASRRDRPLASRVKESDQAIAALEGEVDAGKAARAWRRTLDAPAWTGEAVWIHGDLLPPNLLVDEAGERFAAVIDFGSVGCGDPAVDVIAAWTLFSGPARAAYRSALTVDDGTWLRSAGMALHQALLILPYYRHTHPAFCAMATRTARAVIDEFL